MPDILSLFTGVTQVIETINGFRDKIKDADARNAIADLKLKMADLKEAIVELRNENAHLRDEIKRLSQAPELTKHKGAYIRRGEDGAIEDGPFCPRCYEKDDLVITLTTLGQRMAGMTHLCPECESPHNIHPSAKPSR